MLENHQNDGHDHQDQGLQEEDHLVTGHPKLEPGHHVHQSDLDHGVGLGQDQDPPLGLVLGQDQGLQVSFHNIERNVRKSDDISGLLKLLFEIGDLYE